MSTKIYDAYLFKGNVNKTFKLLKKIKKEVLEREMVEIYHKEIKETVHLLDEYLFLNKKIILDENIISQTPFKENSALIGYKLHQYEINEKKKYPSILDSMSKFDVSIFPISEKKTLLKFYTSMEFHKEVLNKFSRQLKDYHYQNSTDRPEEISSKEWSQRLRDWNKTGIMDSPPIHCGMSFLLSGDTPSFFSYNLVFKALNEVNLSDKERVDFMIENLITDKTFKNLRKKFNYKEDNYSAVHDIYINKRELFLKEKDRLLNLKSTKNKINQLLKKVKDKPINRDYIGIKIKDLK